MVSNELNGYKEDDPLADHRRIKVSLFMTLEDDDGISHDIPINIPLNQPGLYEAVEYVRVYEPIASVEYKLEKMEGMFFIIIFGDERAKNLYAALEQLNPEHSKYNRYFTTFYQK